MLQVAVDDALVGVGAHDGAPRVMSRLVGHNVVFALARVCPNFSGLHGARNVSCLLREEVRHLVLIFSIVEGHAHQGTTQVVAIGWIEVKEVATMTRYCAVGRD